MYKRAGLVETLVDGRLERFISTLSISSSRRKILRTYVLFSPCTYTHWMKDLDSGRLLATPLISAPDRASRPDYYKLVSEPISLDIIQVCRFSTLIEERPDQHSIFRPTSSRICILCHATLTKRFTVCSLSPRSLFDPRHLGAHGVTFSSFKFVTSHSSEVRNTPDLYCYCSNYIKRSLSGRKRRNSSLLSFRMVSD